MGPWELHEGYSIRGGLECSIRILDSGFLILGVFSVRLYTRSRYQRATCVGPYDELCGSRQSTFSSSSHLMSIVELSIQTTACWDIVASTTL